MMTLDELQTIKINKDVVQEAYRQSASRLEDQLAIKVAYEQKAFALLASYMGAAIVLFSVTGFLMTTSNALLRTLFGPFLLAGTCLIGGAICFVLSLRGDRYGVLGSTPRMWLTAGTIDGDDASLPRMLAYITHHHQGRIDASVLANNAKSDWLTRGIYAGIAAPMVLLVGLIRAWL